MTRRMELEFCKRGFISSILHCAIRKSGRALPPGALSRTVELTNFCRVTLSVATCYRLVRQIEARTQLIVLGQ